MTHNAVTHEGKTYTRSGKAYSHVVITTHTATNVDSQSRPLVEWASTLELAQKNQAGHLGRAAKAAKLADGEYLGGVYSTEFYRNFVDSVIVEVEHPEKAPAAGDKPANRSANRTDEDTPVVEDAPVVEPEPVVVKVSPVVEVPATDADKEAAKREAWARNKRASRARLAAKKKGATAVA
jgi:hypothetical protein